MSAADSPTIQKVLTTHKFRTAQAEDIASLVMEDLEALVPTEREPIWNRVQSLVGQYLEEEAKLRKASRAEAATNLLQP
jgi:hypothetical protein